ncbi:MAG: glycosyltransferase family 4 protein [Novosphingobium sp.]
MKIAAFTGSRTISSRRFRVQQYIPALQTQGVEVDEYIARFGAWPPPQTWKRPGWLLANLTDRIGPALASRRYDLTLLQREFVSTMYTLERFCGRPRVVDIDDAIWLNNSRAESSTRKLVGASDGVICGNEFIAQHLGQWNDRLIVLPTAVDTDRFVPALRAASARPIIGWSGLFAGSKFLLAIEPALKAALELRPDAVLRIVSDQRPRLDTVPSDRIEFIRWSPENEIRTIQEMSVGLMPIDDTEWSKGKCSYKMLLYMSCGIPVVVSPYGMNAEVLARGNVGFGAAHNDEWTEAIVSLIDDPKHGRMLGAEGRKVIEAHYALKSVAPRMADYLKSFV